LNRPAQAVLLKYAYSFPKELICNIDYKRGDVLPGYEPDFSVQDTSGKYSVECWIHRKFNGDPVTEAFAYIHRKFAYAVETERWIAISVAAPATDSYLESGKK